MIDIHLISHIFRVCYENSSLSYKAGLGVLTVADSEILLAVHVHIMPFLKFCLLHSYKKMYCSTYTIMLSL